MVDWIHILDNWQLVMLPQAEPTELDPIHIFLCQSIKIYAKNMYHQSLGARQN